MFRASRKTLDLILWMNFIFLAIPLLGSRVYSLDSHSSLDSNHSSHDIHGGVPMGIANDTCDNGQWKIEVDWDNSTDVEYVCHDEQIPASDTKHVSGPECLTHGKMPQPLHVCMTKSLSYTDIPPRGGPHRPLWPVFGEYMYLPPQRWIHALEHGAAVFLYHPCADPRQVKQLRKIATSCLRKHVITPYKELSRDQPFAVVTWRCRILMNKVDVEFTRNFVKSHALKGTETTAMNGQYDVGIIQKAGIVSDRQDTKLCPDTRVPVENLPQSQG